MSSGFDVTRIVKESIVVSVTDYLSFGALFLINVFVNRKYGTDELGTFSLCFTVAQLSVLSLGAGFSAILRRDVALDSARTSTYVVTILRIRAILVGACVAVAAAAYAVSSRGGGVLLYYIAIMVAAKGVDLGCETFYTAHQAVHSIRQFAILKTLHFSSLGGVLVLCCMRHWATHWLYESYLCVSVGFFIINSFVYWRTYPRAERREESAGLTRYVVLETWPLIVNAALFQLSSRSSIIIINSISGRVEQGLYTSGLNILMAATAVANSVGIVLFPYLSRLYRREPRRMATRLKQSVVMLFSLGTVVSVVVYSSTPLLIRLYGKLPASAGQVFRILSLGAAPLFALGVLGYVFTIVGKQRLGMYLSGAMLAVNVAAFYILTSWGQAVGAAAAFVVVQLAAMILFYAAIFRSSAFTRARGMSEL